MGSESRHQNKTARIEILFNRCAVPGRLWHIYDTKTNDCATVCQTRRQAQRHPPGIPTSKERKTGGLAQTINIWEAKPPVFLMLLDEFFEKSGVCGKSRAVKKVGIELAYYKSDRPEQASGQRENDPRD